MGSVLVFSLCFSILCVNFVQPKPQNSIASSKLKVNGHNVYGNDTWTDGCMRLAYVDDTVNCDLTKCFYSDVTAHSSLNKKKREIDHKNIHLGQNIIAAIDALSDILHFHIRCSHEYDVHRFEDYNSKMKLTLIQLDLEREDDIVKHSRIRADRTICVENEDSVSSTIPLRETEVKIEEHKEITFSTTMSSTLEKGSSTTLEVAANAGVGLAHISLGVSVAHAQGEHSTNRSEHSDTVIRGHTAIMSETTKVPAYSIKLDPGTRGCIRIFTNETGKDSHYFADFAINEEAKLDFFKFTMTASGSDYGKICTIIKNDFEETPTRKFLDLVRKYERYFFNKKHLKLIDGKYYLKRVPVTITHWNQHYYTQRLHRVYISNGKPVTTTEFPTFP